MVMAPVFGALSDKVGKRRVLSLLGMLLMKPYQS
jgi:nitrate/nitrite transporter NarK